MFCVVLFLCVSLTFDVFCTTVVSPWTPHASACGVHSLTTVILVFVFVAWTIVCDTFLLLSSSISFG